LTLSTSMFFFPHNYALFVLLSLFSYVCYVWSWYTYRKHCIIMSSAMLLCEYIDGSCRSELNKRNLQTFVCMKIQMKVQHAQEFVHERTIMSR